MKYTLRKVLTMVITTAVLITTMMGGVRPVLAATNGIETFVTSLYSDCLGRNPDPSGFDYWCGKLASGEISGKQCAYGFFFSPEFTAKANSLNDTEYIGIFYNVFLNRGYDAVGLSYWSDKISNTVYDTTLLFSGFADSVEFQGKCARYGITYGPHIDVPNVVRNGSNGSSAAPASAGIPAAGGGAPSGGSAAPAPSVTSGSSSPAPSAQSNPSVVVPATTTPENTPTSVPYNPGTPVIVPMTPTPTPEVVVYSDPPAINATGVTLVVADERRTDEFTPEFAAAYAANKVDSFQLVVTNANTVTYRVISGDAEVSTTGLVTPGRNVWWTEDNTVWYSNPRHTVSENAIDTRIDYFPGESVIRVTADGQTFDVTVTVRDFASEYTDAVLEQFIAENNLRSDEMSVEEKAYLITRYVAHNYNYSIYYGGSADMVTHGCGDCVGSMNLIHRICGMIGLTCWARDARSDWGAGSGHMNAVIYDGAGTYYVCDAGTSGTAPRAFMVSATDTLPVGTYSN